MQGIFFKVSSTKCQRRLDKIGTKTTKVNANGAPVDGAGQRAQKERERIRVDHPPIVGGTMAAITNGQVMVMPRNQEDGQTARTGLPQPLKTSTPKKVKKKRGVSTIIPKKEKMKFLALGEAKPIRLPIGVQIGKDKARKTVETGSTAQGFKSKYSKRLPTGRPTNLSVVLVLVGLEVRRRPRTPKTLALREQEREGKVQEVMVQLRKAGKGRTRYASKVSGVLEQLNTPSTSSTVLSSKDSLKKH